MKRRDPLPPHPEEPAEHAAACRFPPCRDGGVSWDAARQTHVITETREERMRRIPARDDDAPNPEQ